MNIKYDGYIEDIISSSISVKKDLLSSDECLDMIEDLAKSCLKSLRDGG